MKPMENIRVETKRKSPRLLNIVFFVFVAVISSVFILKFLYPDDLSIKGTEIGNLILQPEELDDASNENSSAEVFGDENTQSQYGFAVDFSLKDTEGRQISLSSLRGENVLLVFWATWCGYCKKELPDLRSFVQDYEGRIKVFAIVSREPEDVVLKYTRENEINFPILLDEDAKVWNDYLVRGTPFHFLIDKEGKIMKFYYGQASREVLDMIASMVL